MSRHEFLPSDTGYGNALNVKRTVKSYASAGLAGVMIEDQEAPKRCGHTRGKRVVSRAEALSRVRAAVDAREEGTDILIVARTDARATDGFDEAVARCHAFADIGADVLFFEAPQSESERIALCRVLAMIGNVPGRRFHLLEGLLHLLRSLSPPRARPSSGWLTPHRQLTPQNRQPSASMNRSRLVDSIPKCLQISGMPTELGLGCSSVTTTPFATEALAITNGSALRPPLRIFFNSMLDWKCGNSKIRRTNRASSAVGAEHVPIEAKPAVVLLKTKIL